MSQTDAAKTNATVTDLTPNLVSNVKKTTLQQC